MTLNSDDIKKIISISDAKWDKKISTLGLGAITKDQYLLEQFLELLKADQPLPKEMLDWLAEKIEVMLIKQNGNAAFSFYKRRGRPPKTQKDGRPISITRITSLMERSKRLGFKKKGGQLAQAAAEFGLNKRQIERRLKKKT